MPAGVSWPTYLKFATAAGLSMVAGAQTVHLLYKPLDDLEIVIKQIAEDAEFAEKQQGIREKKPEVKVNVEKKD